MATVGNALFIGILLVFRPIIPMYMRVRHVFEVRGVRDACAKRAVIPCARDRRWC